MAEWKQIHRRRYSVVLRLRVLRLLFGRSRKLSFSRRLTLLSRRYRIAERTIWRWIKRYRVGGVNALRDSLRSDTLTRRAPSVLSIQTGTPARLPLEAPPPRARRSVPLDTHTIISQDAMSGATKARQRGCPDG